MENEFSQIIIVPCCEPKRGGGHLTRCIQLTAGLRAIGREAWFFLPDHDETTQIYKLLKSKNFNFEWVITIEQINKKNIGFIILDRYQTPRKELLKWKEIAPVIGIDEGGSFRDSFDFLIDILIPEKMVKPSANILSAALLKFPANVKEQKIKNDEQKTDRALKLLITFGQEDSVGLGIKTANTLSKIKNNNFDITLLKGNLNTSHSSFPISPSIRVLEAIPNLAECMNEYDLIITHYGITAYEALFAGTPVLLVHPTPYHKKLAKTSGFLTFSKNTIRKFIRPVVHDTEKINIIRFHCETLARKFKLKEGINFASLINDFSLQVNRVCPVCGTNASDKSVSRFNDRTYRRCNKCGVIYMDRLYPPPIEYEREYFFEQYRKQYGKTYLEDFDNIKNSGKHRLEIITNLSRRLQTNDSAQSEKKYLLDIGCAYGPFLSAAKEAGFIPTGIDPAQDAVNYVQQKLGISAIHGFFPNCSLLSDNSSLRYDVVTLWFVIEHFTDCASVLAAIKNILKPGGTLAFSTPSFSGVSGRSNLRRFLSASPADHRTVWSPAACKKALSHAGFKVKKIVVCGHHPERFPVLGKFVKERKSPVYWILLAISKILLLGDTFEMYSRKLN